MPFVPQPRTEIFQILDACFPVAISVIYVTSFIVSKLTAQRSKLNMRIPPEKIDEIRDATDIVEYVGGFVKLKKRGKNFLGLCPFHQEKTPSFNVSPERQMYHCFGCGVGGNVFTFIMERDKVSFVEAVRVLAERAGIALQRYGAEQDQAASDQEQLYEILRAAGLFFHQSLTQSAEGKFALEYFRKRGFTDGTMTAFGLGYAPGSWDALLRHLGDQKFPTDLMERSGLVRKRDDGTFYDYFRGRAMFPIFSSAGRIIAFGARKLREDDPLGKYINSPETPIYNKSRVLYGISHAKEAIREAEESILVEGYADLISVFQAGVKNVVASSGTALTREQIQLIKRYANRIVVVYDADSAGSKAALRGVDLILQEDMDVRVAALPEGDDPDSFVKKNGAEPFRKLIEDAVSFVDFLASAFEKEGKLKTPEGKAQTVRTIVATIAKMRDELKRSFYVKQVADKYKLYESTLYNELEKVLGAGRARREYTLTSDEPQPGEMSLSAPSTGDIPPLERDLLHAMLEGGEEVIRFVFDKIDLDDFRHPDIRGLASTLLQKLEEGDEMLPSSLVKSLEDPDQQRLVAEILFSRHQLSKRWDDERAPLEKMDALRLAQDALVALRRRSLEESINANQRALKDASRQGSDVLTFLNRHQQLLEELKQLEKAGA